MQHLTPVEAARNHLAAYPNAFFTFQRDVAAPYGGGKTNVLAAEVRGVLHPLALPDLGYDQVNTIDQMVTDHNTAAYDRSLNGGQVADEPVATEVPTATYAPSPELDRQAAAAEAVDEDEHEDEVYAEDGDDDAYDEEAEIGDVGGWQRDLNEHEVPAFQAEQARNTQAINDETIVAKMSEYHQVHTAHYPWGGAMVNLLVEAAMIASLADRAALVGPDGRSRIVPGLNGPMSALIVDAAGVRHDLSFIDHRLRVTDAEALDESARTLLVRANDLLLANMKRQVLEIAEALRFIEPPKKNLFAALGDIVANIRTKGEETKGREMRANGSKVVARIVDRNVYNGTTRINLEGTVDDEAYTAEVSIGTDRYNVYVYGVYGEDREAVQAALNDSEEHYREVAGKAVVDNRENVKERVAEYVPSAKELAKRLGQEIRGMEAALAVA